MGNYYQLTPDANINIQGFTWGEYSVHLQGSMTTPKGGVPVVCAPDSVNVALNLVAYQDSKSIYQRELLSGDYYFEEKEKPLLGYCWWIYSATLVGLILVWILMCYCCRCCCFRRDDLWDYNAMSSQRRSCCARWCCCCCN